jgi:ABC-type Zn uptake system ZnuABC Zn-binding protein ZnuA
MSRPIIAPAPLRLSRRSVVAAVFAAALAACASRGAPASPSPLPNPDALNVATTTTVFADIVKNIGGPTVTVTSIIPAGVGPEDYEPKPGDAKTVADADLIVSNGVGLDAFLDRLLAAGGGTPAQLILGAGLPAIDVDGEPNPHFWLDPTIVKTGYLPKIVAALNAARPSQAPMFEQNAATYGAELDRLDADLRAEVATIPEANRKLVTFHDAFPYFAKHFGFQLIGVVVANVGQEPTPAELADLVRTVKAAGVKAVFSESQFNPKLADTLAQEAGITQVVTTLYNDTLGPSPADTYVGMMRFNMQQIVAALR